MLMPEEVAGQRTRITKVNVEAERLYLNVRIA